MDVVQGSQRRKEDFAGLKQVAKIGFGEGAAGITGTGGVEGAFIFEILGVFDDDFALRREKVAIPGVSARQYAIHHVYALRDILGQLFRHANAHYVAGLIFR